MAAATKPSSDWCVAPISVITLSANLFLVGENILRSTLLERKGVAKAFGKIAA
jgi:hypothetical protein